MSDKKKSSLFGHRFRRFFFSWCAIRKCFFAVVVFLETSIKKKKRKEQTSKQASVKRKKKWNAPALFDVCCAGSHEDLKAERKEKKKRCLKDTREKKTKKAFFLHSSWSRLNAACSANSTSPFESPAQTSVYAGCVARASTDNTLWELKSPPTPLLLRLYGLFKRTLILRKVYPHRQTGMPV